MLEAVGCFHDERSTAWCSKRKLRLSNRPSRRASRSRLPQPSSERRTCVHADADADADADARLPSNRWRRHRRECSGPDRDERRATFRASKGPARQTGSISHDHESGPSDARGRQQDGFAARLRRLFPRPHRSGSREAVGFHGTFRNSVAWPVSQRVAVRAGGADAADQLRTCVAPGWDRASPGLPAERGGRRVAAKETLLVPSSTRRSVARLSTFLGIVFSDACLDDFSNRVKLRGVWFASAAPEHPEVNVGDPMHRRRIRRVLHGNTGWETQPGRARRWMVRSHRARGTGTSFEACWKPSSSTIGAARSGRPHSGSSGRAFVAPSSQSSP